MKKNLQKKEGGFVIKLVNGKCKKNSQLLSVFQLILIGLLLLLTGAYPGIEAVLVYHYAIVASYYGDCA
jgi:hypothetical protein